MSSIQPLESVLGKIRAKHLLKRACYNVTKSRIEEFSAYTVDQALYQLTNTHTKKLEQPINYETGNPWIDEAEADADSVVAYKLMEGTIAWWLDEAKEDKTVRSRMAYFLFSFLSIDSDVAKFNRGVFYDYLRLLDRYCLGDIKELLYQITITNLMLHYLDNNENTKTNPNENYAREVLELFTIGKGPVAGIGDYTHYTEDDIVTAARLLTGWVTNYNKRDVTNHGGDNGGIPTGKPVSNKHDFTEKKFSTRFGNRVIAAYDTNGKTNAQKEARMKEELVEFFDMIFDQEETAKYICRRMYRYFVSGKITTEIENDIIIPLANTFRVNYNLIEPITQLLKSKHFYDEDDAEIGDEIIGGMIKSPLELALQTLTLVNYPVPDPVSESEFHYLFFYQRELVRDFLQLSSQKPFSPPSVAGFPAMYEAPVYDKFWFNSTTIIPRYNLGQLLLNKNQTKVDFKVTRFVEENISNPSDVTVLIPELITLLFSKAVNNDRINYFTNEILLDNGSLSAGMWTREWNNYMSTGNDLGTEGALVPLFKALLWSQEYQTN
ncbi:uncharacterized protein (DUF1800 family) [Wenyingzhuangia heitensis]|uniref:Uncharacterized protein (DUF1800 family) n=1 Tax=Wenyingzhuangia heitensis TaxID=1487859 RepID=A0ABX0U5E2_9FLAO|nr:DUF1800 family protein [Wenyingzhuangia heitensis]NIJ44085.1 uncharacterized protein (DUF1800 family) [Wenyingzhuangia heitensis]